MFKIELRPLTSAAQDAEAATLSEACNKAFDLVLSRCPVNVYRVRDNKHMARVWFDGGIDYSVEGSFQARSEHV